MNESIHWLNEFSEQSWQWGSLIAIQAAILSAVILLIVRFFRRASSQFLYVLLLIGLLKFVLPPITTLPFGLFSQFELNSVQTSDADSFGNGEMESWNGSPEPEEFDDSELERNPGESVASAVEWSSEEDLVSTSMVLAPFGHSIQILSSQTRITWTSSLLVFFIAGTGLCLLRLLFQSIKLRKLIRSAEIGEDYGVDLEHRIVSIGSLTLSRNVSILVSPHVTAPFSTGIFRPVIMMPQRVVQHASESQVKAILSHEMAHHLRGDLLVNTMQLLICSVWWFHPSVWLLHQAIRRVRENCCDDFVLTKESESIDSYCDTLLQVAAWSHSQRTNLFAVEMARCGHPLKARLIRIMDPQWTVKKMTPFKWGILGLAALILLPGIRMANSQIHDQVDKAHQGDARQPLAVEDAEDELVGEDVAAVEGVVDKPKANQKRQQEKNKSNAAKVGVNGIVLDTNGQPIHNVKVTIWSDADQKQTTTNEQGRFSVEGVVDNGFYLFAKADGFRWHGEFATHSPEFRLALIPDEQKRANPLRAPGNEVLPEDGRRFVRNEFLKFVEIVMNSDEANSKMDVQRMLAKFDPDSALAYLDDKRFDAEDINWSNKDTDHNAWHRNCIHTFVARKWVTTDPPKALEQIKKISDLDFTPWDEILTHYRTLGKAKLKDQLLQAERFCLSNGNVKNPHLLSVVAKHWHSWGDVERANQLAARAAEAASPRAGNEWGNYEIGMTAAELALVDAKLAADLVRKIKPEKDYEKNRYYSNVAHRMAEIDPVRAFQLVEEMPSPDRFASRIVYHMGLVDHFRAGMLIEKIEQLPLKAYSLAMLAESIHKKNPKAAKARLKAAFDLIDRLIETKYKAGRSIYEPFPVAIGMLPSVHVVAPDEIDDYLYRVLSWRRNITYGRESSLLGPYGENQSFRLSFPSLAAMVAAYDKELARKILIPPNDEELKLGIEFAPSFFLGGLAAIDPIAAVKLVDDLPHANRRQIEKKVRAWRDIIAMADRTEFERANFVRSSQYNLWIPGEFD